jgi:hypothetical protein
MPAGRDSLEALSYVRASRRRQHYEREAGRVAGARQLVLTGPLAPLTGGVGWLAYGLRQSTSACEVDGCQPPNGKRSAISLRYVEIAMPIWRRLSAPA